MVNCIIPVLFGTVIFELTKIKGLTLLSFFSYVIASVLLILTHCIHINLMVVVFPFLRFLDKLIITINSC